MTELTEEAAPDVTVDGPAPTSLLSEVSETKEEQASPEQTETETATDGDPQGEQAGAPESYDFVMPEGVTIDKDSAPIAAYSELAKSLNLPQDKAQEGLTKLVAAQAEHSKAQFSNMVKTWETETRNDPEIGGEKLQATLVKANQFLATVQGGEELKALLNQTGLGNHKAVVRFFANGRDVIGDDHFVAGNDVVEKQATTAQSIYSKSKMNP